MLVEIAAELYADVRRLHKDDVVEVPDFVKYDSYNSLRNGARVFCWDTLSVLLTTN